MAQTVGALGKDPDESPKKSAIFREEMIKGHNQCREKLGYPHLDWNPELETLAAKLAKVFAQKGRLDPEDVVRCPVEGDCSQWSCADALPPDVAAELCCKPMLQAVVSGATMPGCPVFLSSTKAMGAARVTGPNGTAVMCVYIPPSQSPVDPDIRALSPASISRIGAGAGFMEASAPTQQERRPSRSSPLPLEVSTVKDAVLAYHNYFRRSLDLPSLRWADDLHMNAKSLVSIFAENGRLTEFDLAMFVIGSCCCAWRTQALLLPPDAIGKSTSSMREVQPSQNDQSEVPDKEDGTKNPLCWHGTLAVGAAVASRTTGTYVVCLFAPPPPWSRVKNSPSPRKTPKHSTPGSPLLPNPAGRQSSSSFQEAETRQRTRAVTSNGISHATAETTDNSVEGPSILARRLAGGATLNPDRSSSKVPQLQLDRLSNTSSMSTVLRPASPLLDFDSDLPLPRSKSATLQSTGSSPNSPWRWTSRSSQQSAASRQLSDDFTRSPEVPPSPKAKYSSLKGDSTNESAGFSARRSKSPGRPVPFSPHPLKINADRSAPPKHESLSRRSPYRTPESSVHSSNARSSSYRKSPSQKPLRRCSTEILDTSPSPLSRQSSALLVGNPSVSRQASEYQSDFLQRREPSGSPLEPPRSESPWSSNGSTKPRLNTRTPAYPQATTLSTPRSPSQRLRVQNGKTPLTGPSSQAQPPGASEPRSFDYKSPRPGSAEKTTSLAQRLKDSDWKPQSNTRATAVTVVGDRSTGATPRRL